MITALILHKYMFYMFSSVIEICNDITVITVMASAITLHSRDTLVRETLLRVVLELKKSPHYSYYYVIY